MEKTCRYCENQKLIKKENECFIEAVKMKRNNKIKPLNKGIVINIYYCSKCGYGELG
jgi:hypothetical protein